MQKEQIRFCLFVYLNAKNPLFELLVNSVLNENLFAVTNFQKGVIFMPDLKQKSLCSLFCCNYARLGDVYEAALRSGFPPETALADGTAVISQPKYRRLISKMMQKSISPRQIVMTGLERLAFGRANDAALLVFSEEIPTAQQLNSLDLFNVSEMKKVKGGGVEIKLFDRQKAMERIYEYASEENTSSAAANLLEALAGSGDENNDEV